MYTYTVAAVLALATGANAGVCGNVGRDYGMAECASSGCRPDGNTCKEPAACSDGATVYYGSTPTGVTALRKPLSAETARLCDANSDCTAMYRVDLSRTFTTGPPNCNDEAMLPPHGVDQTECSTHDLFKNVRLQDYTGHPFKNDGVKQSLAAAKNAVTALTESTGDCYRNGNTNCAFPLGFYSDNILKNKKVCINVRNVEDKWVEIMASSTAGDASFCVRDRLKDDSMGGDKGCTKAGDLVDIRESGQSAGTDDMWIEFFTEDNYDDADIDFQWRIAASEIPTKNADAPNVQPDAEDWSQERDGAGFPMSLMKPYPEGYEGDPVFETQGTSSASWASPMFFVVLAAAAIAMLC